MRHQTMELSNPRDAFLASYGGATIEDDNMSAGMVADLVLWVLLATAVALIWLGCRMTKRRPKLLQESSESAMDQAA